MSNTQPNETRAARLELKPIEIKRMFEAKHSDFCTLCGHRYEAGSQMTVLTTEPTPRGRIAHESCVTKYNAKLAADQKRAQDEKERGRVSPVRMDIMDVIETMIAAGFTLPPKA